MKLITIEQARTHINADSGDETDDALLTTYCNGAEAACARLANRNLYPSTVDLNAAIATVQASMAAAYAAYDTAIEAANALTDERMKAYVTNMAAVQLTSTTVEQDAILHGLALDAAADADGQPARDDIILAILLTVGHSYRNRENVATGQSASAVEVPMTAQHIMAQHRWIGPL